MRLSPGLGIKCTRSVSRINMIATMVNANQPRTPCDGTRINHEYALCAHDGESQKKERDVDSASKRITIVQFSVVSSWGTFMTNPSEVAHHTTR